MVSRFFSPKEFNDHFSSEIQSASDVYERRSEYGMTDYSLATYDFDYISDSEQKLQSLGEFLIQHHGCTIRKIIKGNEHWELYGEAPEFPVDRENLKYWALDLYIRGYEFDCVLRGYGATADINDQLTSGHKKTAAFAAV
jgi:hypothetical protein